MTDPAPDESLRPAERRFPVRLVLLGVMAVVSVAFGFLAPTINQARYLVQHYGYYAIAGTFAWMVVAVVRIFPAWRATLPKMTRGQGGAVLAVILGVTVTTVLTVPYTYKVLYDEHVLQATAWCMHQTRTVGTIVRGYPIEGVFTALYSYLDKRPCFYPFLVSLLHDLTGFREGNAFALNTMLMPVALGLFYLLVRRLCHHAAALAALLALGGLSLLAQNAASAGMEMLNLTMLIFAMHLAAHYLGRPDDRSLTALILGAVLLAQTRYESGFYVLPVAVIVLAGWRCRGRLLLPAAAMLAPALLIPCALQNTYLSGTPMLWELRENAATRFGLDYLGNNLMHAGQFFFSFSGKLTNSWWLGLAGFPALVWAAVTVVRHLRHWRRASPAVVTTVLFGGAIFANLALLMCYYWGELDDPIVSRLSLPFSMLLALCIGWALARLPGRWTVTAPRWALVGAGFCYLVSGLVGNATYWTLNVPEREIEWQRKTVEAMPPASRLIITDRSALIWLVNKVPTVTVSNARSQGEHIRYHMEQHTFTEVLVLQDYRPTGPAGAFQLDPEARLPDTFVLEPVMEHRFGTRIARISRLLRIEPEKPKTGASGNLSQGS